MRRRPKVFDPVLRMMSDGVDLLAHATFVLPVTFVLVAVGAYVFSKYWVLIVGSFAGLVAATVLWNVYLYWSSRPRLIPAVPQQEDVIVRDTTSFDEIDRVRRLKAQYRSPRPLSASAPSLEAPDFKHKLSTNADPVDSATRSDESP